MIQITVVVQIVYLSIGLTNVGELRPAVFLTKFWTGELRPDNLLDVSESRPECPSLPMGRLKAIPNTSLNFLQSLGP